MALSNDDIRACANRLHQAEKTRTQIRQLSQDFPDISIADAYAIQKAWVDVKVAEGRIVRGHKIGLTSKAMQSALGINEPDSGVLLDDMFFADGGLVPTERFIATRVASDPPAGRIIKVTEVGSGAQTTNGAKLTIHIPLALVRRSR